MFAMLHHVSVGALGEGSGWDLRIRPAPAAPVAPASAASGNLGTWKSGNLEIWEFGDLGTWKSGNLEIWGPGNPESWVPKNQTKIKLSKFKSVLPKMSARSGLVGKNPPGPIRGHLKPFFPWTEQIKKKNVKILAISLGGPMGPIHPVWGPCCYPPEVGE